MRRALLLVALWVVGVTASVAFAFAAVDRVANRVAPSGVGRLSAGAVDRALGSTVPSTRPTTTRHATASSSPASTSRGATTTTRASGPGATQGTGPPATGGGGPPTTAPFQTPATTAPSPPTTSPQNTVTTSQGGTVWTRCSGAEHIVYVAAVPKSGYERTRDIESPDGIEQWFESDRHLSKIALECSNGIVHAEVHEETESVD